MFNAKLSRCQCDVQESWGGGLRTTPVGFVAIQYAVWVEGAVLVLTFLYLQVLPGLVGVLALALDVEAAVGEDQEELVGS